MSKKKQEKSPYGEHSVEDVNSAEAGFYYIQLGADIFVSEEGKMAFDKERTDYFFSTIWDGLNDMKENGSAEEKFDAEQCFLMFRIFPLRIH